MKVLWFVPMPWSSMVTPFPPCLLLAVGILKQRRPHVG